MKTERNLIQISLLCAAMLQAATSGAQPVTNISAGDFHSLFLKSNGSLWAMGNNFYGQLGDGSNINTNRPEQIVASNVTAIAASDNQGNHSLFLKSDGSLWAMGRNDIYPALGDGSNVNTNQPEQIVAGNVTAIAAGDFHNLFLKSDGSLWAFGFNGFGQLGDGTYTTTNRPKQIVSSNVTAIAAGEFHSLFLKGDGSLWAMGKNYSGQLGDGTASSFNTVNVPEEIVSTNVIAIAAGGNHSLFLKRDGSLWAMGNNQFGQLGDGLYNTNGSTSTLGLGTNRPQQIVTSNVTAVAAGYSHSIFLKNNGSLWVMGYNKYGQLGDGAAINTNRPEQIVSGNVRAIAGGNSHSLFLKSDGSLWAFGLNSSGQLGDGSLNPTNRPELILGAYNQISGRLLGSTNIQLSFVGIAGANYALDRSSSLSPPNWLPQLTNPAGSFGALLFTNPPDPATNNFWRIRSVP